MTTLLRECDNRDETEAALVELAEKHTLVVSSLLQLPPRARELCGLIILGQREQSTSGSRGRFTNPVEVGVPLPPALADYRVILQAINIDPDSIDAGYLCYTDGTRTRREVIGKGEGNFGLEGASPMELITDNRVRVKLDAENRCSVGLRASWLALKEAGEGIVYAQRPEHKKRAWRCREVAPEAVSTPQPLAPASEKRARHG